MSINIQWSERLFEHPNLLPVEGPPQEMFIKTPYTQDGVSTCLPRLTRILLQNIPNEHYLLCPIYNNEGGNDWQVGISGTAHVGEELRVTAIRELAEELGLIPMDPNFNLTSMLVETPKITSGTILNINRTFPNQQQQPSGPEINDDNRKIVILIHGTKEDIDNYLRGPITLLNNNDQIVGLMGVPVLPLKLRYLPLYTGEGEGRGRCRGGKGEGRGGKGEGRGKGVGGKGAGRGN